ncbi:MAG: hypothetical protein NC098_08195 [Lachnoclostridium sp.]|nr:hypothetical protein [Lachnoclostridium sp.]
MKTLLYCFISASAGIIIGTSLAGCTRSQKTSCSAVADTIVIHDTVTMVRPSAFDSLPAITVVASLPRVADTLPPDTLTDTVKVYVPITTYRYRSDLYEATVSGFRASLDSITVYPVTKFIRRRPPRWTLSVTAGACLTPRGLQPGITLGISYTLLSL